MGELAKKLREKAPTLAAGGIATLTATLLSRFTGAAGTLIGTVFAAVLTGTASTVYEHGIEKARIRAEKIRKAHLQGVIRDDRVWDELFGPKNKGRDIPWKRIAVITAALITVCMTAATATEYLSARSLAVTGGTVRLSGAQPKPSPTQSPYSPPPYYYPSPSSTPSPGFTTPSPVYSPTPGATASSPTPSPSGSPGATPTPGTTPSP